MNVDRVAVARLTRTRGIRGEIVGIALTSHIERLESLGEVVLEVEGKQHTLAVEHVWFHDGRPVFKFHGVDSIEEAETWKGAVVLAERLPVPEGEYAFADLIGCAVAEDGRDVGVVEGLEEYGGPPLLKVRRPDGREILIPFARSICREIDIAQRKIRVVLPEGLSDLP
jgi:16S rRNA processing protein RimM